jgi:MFS transporter, DHA3 family, macrolide efflux protein
VLTAFALSMLGLGAVNVLFIPYLSNLHHVPTEALGAIEAVQVAGMVLGSALVAVTAARLKSNQIVVIGIMLVGLSVALFGASPFLSLAMVALFFVGLVITPMQAAAATIFQATVPDEKRGRVSSALNTAITLASVISMGCAGLLGDALGIRQVFYLAGVITICAGLLAAALMRSPAPHHAPLPQPLPVPDAD